MGALCARLAELLAGELGASCQVERYVRLEPPRRLTLYVQPSSETGESSYALGNITQSRLEVKLVLEIPWNDRADTMDALLTATETARRAIRRNRDIAPLRSGMLGPTRYAWSQRSGAAVPTFCATVAVAFESLAEEDLPC